MTTFRKSRILLAAIVLLFVGMVIDIWVNREDIFEEFGEQFVNEQRTDMYMEGHHEVEKTIQRQLEMGKQNIHEVMISNNTWGKIRVTRVEGNNIILRYKVTATAKNEEQVNQRLSSIMLEQKQSNGVLSYFPSEGSLSKNHKSIVVDYELLVPDGMKLRVKSEGGSVLVHGIKADVFVESLNGLLEVVRVGGNIEVKSSHQNIYLSNIEGNIALENRFGYAEIEQIDGTIELDSRDGQNVMAQITDGVRAVSEYGSISLRDISGPVDIVSRSTRVQLANIRSSIKVDNQWGPTKLNLSESEGYTIKAMVDRGSIQTSLPFTIEEDVNEASSTRLTGVLGKGNWNVELNVKSALLIIHSNQPISE